MRYTDAMSTARKIIHIDMDAFFAAVEQRDTPALRGKAIAVGQSGARGVVMTASYEARAFGVRSAMPSSRAKQRCPHLIFVPARFEVYRAVSKQLHEVFYSYTDLVEPLSLDEAYLDVTQPKCGPQSGTLLARAIKADIVSATQLTASAGVANGKFLAKMASGRHKPNGLTVITPEKGEAFIEALPIELFHGVGRVTSQRMKELGIHTGADLKKRSLEELVQHFGKLGQHYYKLARAQDDRPVDPHRERKSISVEDTFTTDTRDLDYLSSVIVTMASQLAQKLGRADMVARTVTLKLKYDDFSQRTRSQTAQQFVSNAEEIARMAVFLLRREALERPLRLIGVGVSGLEERNKRTKVEQPTLGLKP